MIQGTEAIEKHVRDLSRALKKSSNPELVMRFIHHWTEKYINKTDNGQQELLDFQKEKIEKLISEVNELQQQKFELERYIIELCDRDCPQEYRDIVLSEIKQN